MDSLRLFVLGLPVALSFVEPPTNVSMWCQSFHNVLEWTYGQLVPGLRFKVSIQPYIGKAQEIWVDPPDLRADVSAFSDPGNIYQLLVTAVIGANESESAPPDGVTYSYYMDNPVSQICNVDLPPVTITALPDDMVKFSFLHPALFYQNSLPKKKTNGPLPTFLYEVRLINQKHPHHLRCVENLCEDQIPADAAEPKHCVNISGEMMKMEVRSRRLFCALPFTPPPAGHNNMLLYVLVPLVLLLMVAFILLLIYKKKTSPSSEVPNAMKITSARAEVTAQEDEEEPVVVTHVEPSSPTPLLQHQESADFSGPTSTVTRCDEFISIRRNGEAVHGDREAEPEGQKEDDEDGDEGQGYRGGSGLEEEDEEEEQGEDSSEGHSGYERRDLLVDLGQNLSANV